MSNSNKQKHQMEKFSAMAALDIVAPALEIWHVLTTPELIKQCYFGVDVITDWKEGSEIIYKGEWKGQPYEEKGWVLKVGPEKYLLTSLWTPMWGSPDIPENYQRLSYSFLQKENRTELTVTQENIPSKEMRDATEKSWNVWLNNLKEFVEKRQSSS